MTVLYKSLEAEVSAVEANPLIRQNFSNLGVTHRGILPVQRKEVFNRLGWLLKNNPENPVVYLNLAFFASAAGRFDIAEIFSGAAFSFNKGRNRLGQQDQMIAGNVYRASKAKAHHSDEFQNPLIDAARECGIIKPSAP